MQQKNDFEADVLVLAFRDTGVLAKYSSRLDPVFFTNIVYGNLWILMRRMFVKYQQAPSFIALETEISNELSKKAGIRLFTKEDIPTILQVLPLMVDSEYYIMDRWIRESLDQWIATRAYHVANVRAEKAILDGDPFAVPQIFKEASAAAHGGDTQHIDFFARMGDTARASAKDLERRINTGLINLDSILGGGLQQGELGLIFGVEGVGKSFLATQIGGAAVTQKKRVLHVTNEMTTTAQERRYISWFVNLPNRQLWEHADEIETMDFSHFQGLLDVRYVTPGAAPGEVTAILEEAHIKGQPYKLVLIDYIDQFRKRGSENQQEYQRIIDILSEFSAMAKTRENGGQDACICAVTHANSKAYNQRLGDSSFMGGSVIGKNKVIDFGVYLGQDEDLLKKNLVAATITKLRNCGGKGRYIYLRSEFATSRFHDHHDYMDSTTLETPSIPQ